MELSNQQLVDHLFNPLRASFSSPRPDGSVAPVRPFEGIGERRRYERIGPGHGIQASGIESQEKIRLELVVRAGNIPADLRKILKEQDSVLNYRIA